MRLVRFAAIAAIIVGGVGLWLSLRQQAPATGSASGIGTFPGASVVVVTFDTTRADRFGCYGSTAGLTPFVDDLARRGVVFEQAQAVGPVTLPSHVSIFTGLYPTHHGVRNNGMFSVPEDVETLAEVYQRRGYATGAFISAQVLVRRYGLDRGFDVYDDDLSLSLKVGLTMVPSRRGNLTLDSALEWLRGIEPSQPVFMWLHLYDPHAPYDAPAEFREKFPADAYGAEIAFADSLVGQLVAELERTGRFDNTILTVMADHGEALGEHGEMTHGILLYQPTIHVPWVLVAPHQRQQVRIRQPVSGTDLAPTLAALTEVAPPNADRLDGKPALAASTLQATGERDLYFETMLPVFQYGWSALRGLRRGEWEIIDGNRSELFNLTQDPRELTDLAGREPMQLSYLEQKVAEIATSDDAVGDEALLEMGPSEREALEALGYVTTSTAPRRESPDPRDVIEGHVELERARGLMAAGRLEEALQYADAMLASDPENLAALTLKGQTLMNLNRLDEAGEVFEHALELDPRNTDTMTNLCGLEMQRRNFDRVGELAELGRHTRSPFGIFDAIEARSLLARGRFDDAQALVERALAERPGDPDLLTVRASLETRHDDAAAAERDLRQALANEPYHKPARRQLSQLLMDAGRIDEAVAVFDEMLTISPGDAESLLAIGSILQQQDPQRALPYLEEAVRLAPGKPLGLTTLGIAYVRTNRLGEAEAVLRRAMELQPDQPDISNNLGIVLVRQGKYDDAIAVLRDILAAHPGHHQARNNLAIALGESGDVAGAEREARRALVDRPGFLDAQLTLAAALHRSGQRSEEYQVLATAHHQNPSRDDVGLRLAVAAAATGHCDETLELLEPVLETPVQLTADTHFAAATCLEQGGRVREALRHYEDAARIGADTDLQRRAKEGIQRLSLRLGASDGG